jgi:hypothetical protein
VQVKDYHERQYADTQTAGEKDSQLSSSATQDEQLITSAAVSQLSSTAGGHHDDDRLEIAKDGLGLILERSDKQPVTGSKHISVILCFTAGSAFIGWWRPDSL